MPDSPDSAPADGLRVPGPLTRRDAWTVLAIVCVGLLLRAALPARMAVEHFDEGVYASNLYAGNQDPPYAYPDRHLYAPPLLPAVLESAIEFSTGRPHAVMWVNVLAGTLSVIVLWWGARQCFGSGAALVTAMFAATSDYHVGFSRMALTDVPLCLWMSAGVFTGWRAVLTGRPVWVVAAAASAALAWWTKYNGWLTLAVTGSGTAAWLLFDRHRSVSASQAFGRWGALAILAVLFWLPFLLWWIPQGSSYADISANHSRYFVGLSGWWSSFTRHLASQRYLDGWTTVAGLVLAPVVAAWANCERFTWNGDLAGRTARLWVTAIAAGLGVGVVAIAGGSAMALSLVAAGGIVVVGVQRMSSGRSSSYGTEAISADRGPPPAGVGHAGRKVRQHEPEAQAGETARDVTSGHGTHTSGAAFRLAAWMLAAWFIGLLVATPLYHPYPRLALPWLTACWLAAGAVIGRFLDRPFAAPQATSGPGRRRLVAVVLLLSLYPIASWRGPPFVPPRWTAWQDRAGLQRVATDLLRDAARTTRELGPSGHPDLDAVIYVYAEPGLFFQLESVPDDSGLKFVASPATSLALQKPLEVTVFLATGPHADRMGVAQDPAVRQYRLVASYPWQPSDLVALDEYPAAQLLKDRGAPTEEIRLYLVHSPSATR